MRFDERKTAEYQAKVEALQEQRQQAKARLKAEAPKFMVNMVEMKKKFKTLRVDAIYDPDGDLIFKNEL